jgi:ArsR family transcriptional regulator, arsenate/arsenite/antimonite-responsive transcriptional repressor
VVAKPPVVTCAPGALIAPLSREQAADLARQLKAVADPARLQLLALLRASTTGEVCVCDLTEPLGLSQPTVSHHLRILSDAGLITRERRGTWSYYSLVPNHFDDLLRSLSAGTAG